MSVASPLRAAGLSLAAYSLWVGVDALSKLAAATLSVFERCFFSLGVASLVFLGLSFRGRGLAELRTSKPFFHFTRALMFCGGVTLLNYAIGHMPLANLFAVSFTFPLTVAAIGATLGETIKPGQWGAIILGFGGALVAVGPSQLDWADWNALAVAAVLGSNFCFCFYSMTVKKGGAQESLTALAFYPAVTTCLILGSLLTLQQGWVLDPVGVGYVCLAGLVNGIAWRAYVAAFRYGSDSYVVTFNYIQIAIGAVVGWLIWSDRPTVRLGVGAVIVIASGLYVIWGGLRKGREMTPEAL